ncbi:MAG: M1 family metallopeptidase [Flavobacteriales bacterium]|nr:M1 family metallopeptidase [Flavobacteriales bacterium]
MKKLAFVLCFFIATQAVAQQFNHYIADPDGRVREHQLDITHMAVNVKFEPEKGMVHGVVTHTFVPLRKTVDSVFWDAPKIAIKSAKLVGDKTIDLKFKTTDDGVITYFASPLKWDATYMLQFEYDATPQKGIYFIGWNSPKITDPRNQTRQQIWTQGQGIDNRHWIPMYDNMNDKFTTETIVSFNSEFKVLSNGQKLSEKKNKDNTTTWHYKMQKPHAGYLLMLAIDRFAVKETKTKNGTPIQFWYYPEHPEKLELSSLYSEKIIEFLEDETGFAYPWGSYSQVMVQDFMYGAMENTSATIFGDFFNVDEYSFNDRSYVSVNAHEATHQWFGDLVTARSNTGTWLQESFATYYAKLFMGSIYGPDEYRWEMRGEVNSALNASKSDNFPIAHAHSGSARVYPKGSTVLHMLRYVLGDEEYKRVINYYLQKHGFGNVETNDLVQAIQDVLGMNLDWFFDQWLYRGGEPHYQVSYQNYGQKTVMTIEQIQQQDMTTGLFKMPIKCGVYFTDGTFIEKTEWIENQTESIVFEHDNGKQIAYVLFDINSEILKQVTFKKSAEELIEQLKNAKNMIDRYDALLGLAEVDIETKRSALQETFQKETFYAMQSEIVKQLLNDAKSNSFLISNLPKADVRVKRTLLQNVENVETYRTIIESSLSDKSYINIEKALQLLCETNSKNKDAYFDRTKAILGQSHNIRITWLAYKIDQLKSDSAEMMNDKTSNYYTYLNELSSYTTNLYEFRTRTNAMNVIKKFNYLSAESIEGMLDAATSKNGRLASPASEVLRWYSQQYAIKNTIQTVFEQSQLSDEQKEKLRKAKLVE